MKRNGLRLRKWLVVVLAVCLVGGILIVPDGNVAATEEGDFEYQVLKDGTIEIIRYNGNDTEVIIPDKINGMQVTSIGFCSFERCSSLISIKIPEGVTNVGNYAFLACKNLKNITIPKSVISIGVEAFGSCRSLKNVVIPDGVVSVGDRAFCLCTGLESITIPKSVANISGTVFAECSGLNDIILDAESLYYTLIDGVLYNKDVTKLIVCPKKKREVNVPESVITIDKEAFSRCQFLTNIIIPNGVLYIGEEAFEYCTTLSSITIPKSVDTIGENTFMQCNKLNNISLDHKNQQYTLIDNVLYEKNIEKLIVCPREKAEVNIPESVTAIGESAFSGCKNLITIIIPEGVTKIPYSAFNNCISLSNIIIPNGVVSIEGYAFAGCSNLENITIPDGVSIIDYYAFARCSSLRNVAIPEGITDIRHNAFGYCYNLTLTNNSSAILDLNLINTEAQWYDTSTGELIDELAKGSAIAIPKPVEIQKSDITLDSSSQFVDKYGKKVETADVVIVKSTITQEQQDIIHAVEQITQNAAEKSKVFYYDISAYINAIGGEPAILSGNIMIRLDYPAGVTKDYDIVVLHNTSRLGDVKKYDDYFTFKTDGLSPFTIIALEAGTSSDNTAVRDFVNRIYTLVLAREADETGLTSWTNALVSKKSNGVDIGYGFVFSDECKEKNLSNEEFVEILYNTFMNRPSDEGGKSAWVSQLDAGVEREKVFEGFIYSAEFSDICSEYGINVGSTSDVGALVNTLSHYRNRNADITKFVARCYTQAMERDYEPEGLDEWCKVIIEKSNTPKQVAQNFIFSDEFTLKNLSNEEYVKVLYRTFMGREADEGGLSAWVEVLKSGREDRAKVLEGFSDSVEFDGILKTFGLN